VNSTLQHRSSRTPATIVSTAAVIAVLGLIFFTGGGRTAAHAFLASLRIAKPQAVTAGVPASAGAGGARPLQTMIGGMIGKSVGVTLDEPDQYAANAAAANKLTGFPARLPHTRTDAATMSVLGAHTIEMAADRTQLAAIFAQAGRKDALFPATVEGATVTLRAPRALRVQYGNCPVPVANTIQNQIQGPPPPSTDNANCVVLVESPALSADVPDGLDMTSLMELVLELSGMSPVQTKTFQQTLDWKSALAVSLPRNLRSLDVQDVGGAHAMLFVTAGRRGPTWELVWAKDGMVYALTGYGNSGDAALLANSIN
jgi:hypothetical protein